MNKSKNISGKQAQDALESIKTMKSAGYRLAVPRRLQGIGVAFFMACLFALYALENPYPYIVFPIIGLAVFLIAYRERAGAYGRDFPETKSNKWALLFFVIVMVMIFFGTVYLRRAYDLTWVPIAVGLLVGLVVFLLSESERRSYLAKVDGGPVK